MCLALTIGRKAPGFEHEPATGGCAGADSSVKRCGNFAYEGEPRFHGRAVLGLP